MGNTDFIYHFIIYFSTACRKKIQQVFCKPPDRCISRNQIYHFLFYYPHSIYLCLRSWFRGYLLNDSIHDSGLALAIFINVIFYSLLHIVNGKDEVIACIPFGILLCCLCIWQGAVWPAIFLHLALTVPYEMRCLKKINIEKTESYENFNNRGLRIPR